MKVKLDPARFRCPGVSTKASTKKDVPGTWCYTVSKSKPWHHKKGFIVEVKLYGGLLTVGHLGRGCTRHTGHASGRKAKVFESAEAADRAAQKCILKGRGKRKK